MEVLKKSLYVLVGAVIASLLFIQFPEVLDRDAVPESELNESKVSDAISDGMSKTITLPSDMTVDKKALDSSRGLLIDQVDEPEAAQASAPAYDKKAKVLPSRLAFDESAYVLNRGENKELTISATNIDWFNVRLYRLDERAITETLSTSVLLDNNISLYRLRNLIDESVVEVWRGKVEGSTLNDQAQDLTLPLNPIFKEYKNGVFLVVAEDQAEKGLDYVDGKGEYLDSNISAQWVNFTDLSLTSYNAENGIYASVRSFESGQSVGDTTVTLIAHNNEILEQQTSSPKQMVHFSKAITNGDGANRPRALFAANSQGDFAFLDLQKPALDLTSFDIAGRAFLKDENLFFYTDRGIYRPGEEVRFSGLVRNKTSRALLDIPVTMTILNPKGIVHRAFKTVSVQAGQLQQDFTLPASAMRGQWTMQAKSSKNPDIQFELWFEVKDFVPELIEASIKDSASLFGARSIVASVSSSFLYGAPASGLNYQAELQFTKTRSPFTDYSDYLFGDDNQNIERKIVSLEDGLLDEKGETTLNADLLESLGEQAKDFSLYFATLDVGVQETGGRFKHTQKRYFVDKASQYVGVKPSFKDDEIDYDTQARFEVISIDAEGERSVESLKWQLQKVNHFYNWSKNRQGDWRYSFEKEYVTVQSGEVDLAQEATLTTDALPWGRYRLIVDGKQTGSIGAEYFFYSGFVWNQDTASESPSRIELFTDKKNYSVGDEMTVHFESLVDGIAQVIVANDEVQQALELPVKKGSNQFNLTYKPQFKQGVYVMANVIRQSNLADAERFPIRSVGISWVALSKQPIEVVLVTPSEIEPRRLIQIPVQVNQENPGSIHLKVNAVDEGILSLTNFKTPDPFDYFWGQRRFSIDVRDEYNRLFTKQGKSTSVRTGAGADEGGSIGGASLSVVPAKTISLFDNEVKLDEQGRGLIELEIPDFQGRLRLMTIASSNQSAGQAESYLTVRDKIVSTVVMPNFLAPDDEGVITVRYYNTTDTEQPISIAWKSTNDVLAISNTSGSFNLAPKESKTLTYPLKAKQSGIGQVQLELSTNAKVITRTFDMQVRYQGSAIPKVSSEHLDTGPFVSVGKEDKDLLSKVVSFSPLKGLNIGLLQASVKSYPYNCSEQLTNMGLPMLVEYKALSSSAQSDKRAKLKKSIQENVDELTSRVNSYGRMGIWSFHGSETISSLYPYIVEYLIQARAAGIYISSDVIDALTERMIDKTYRESNNSNEQAYAAYVATLKDPQYIRYTHQTKDVKSVLGKLRQAVAFKEVGLLSESANALDDAVERLKIQGWDTKENDDYYQSNLSYQLSVLLNLARLGQTQLVIKSLDDFTHKNDLTKLNLREKSLVLQLLGAISDQQQVKVEHQNEFLPQSFLGASITLDPAESAQDQVFNFSQPLWATETGYIFSTKQEGGYRSHIIDEEIISLTNGKSALLDELEVGERLQHKVTIQIPKTDDQYIIDIPIPAGLEVIQTLETTGVYSKKGDYKYRDFDTLQQEFDRVVASSFGDGYSKGVFIIEFVTRVVTPGEYVKPGVRVENMYRPEDIAITDQVRIKIR